MNAPNILLIMTDQQRWDTLGCYGCTSIPTPALDQLAAGGIVFERCYVNATICTPSRACMLTGRTLPAHGVYRLHDTLPDDQVLLPALLRERGYQTALVGKLHVSGRMVEAQRRHPHDGFEGYEWCLDPQIHLDSPYNAYAQWLGKHHPDFLAKLQAGGQDSHPAAAHFSTWAAERAVAFLGERDRSRPFFLNVSFFDPHSPYFDYPPEAGDLVDRSKIPPVQPLTAAHAPVPDGVARERRRLATRTMSGERGIDAVRHGYLASVAFLDQQVGRILAELNRQELTEETLVLFVSDHGDMIGDLELLTKGAFFYDPCTRVPMLLRLPGGAQAGSRVADLVQPHDLATTLLIAAGADAHAVAAMMPQGLDLAALARDRAAYPRRRDHAVSMYRNSGYGDGGRYYDPPIYGTMFHDGRFKLSLFHDPSAARPSLEGELYDMQEDPNETRNLWNDGGRRGVREGLIARLSSWLVATEATGVAGRGGTSWPRRSQPSARVT